MLVIEINLNIFVLGALLLICFGIGYLIRSQLIRTCKTRIVELEKEMLNNHARILELEKEKAETQRQSVVRDMKP
jgi:hypothetical protein